MTYRGFTCRSLWSPSLLALACAILPGCFTPRTTEEMRVTTLKAVMENEHQTAVGTLNELYDSHLSGEIAKVGGSPTQTDSVNNKQALLWHMERGLVDHVFGDVLSSNIHLDAAGILVDQRRTKTLVTEGATFVANDTLRDYPGNAFEHTQVDYYRALNRLLQAQFREGVYQPTHILVTKPPKPGEKPPAPISLSANDGVSANDNYDRAVNFTRRMTINQLTETKEAADGNRYDDDPFARFLAATLTYAPKIGERAEANRQFADVMLKKAMEGYTKQQTVLGSGNQPFRYEVARRPATVERMFIRHCRAYDPQGFQDRLGQFGLSDNDARLENADFPPGHGSVLILNHVGYITHPEVLDIRLITSQFRGTGTSTDRKTGRTTTSTFHIGAVAFWATGPGSEVVKTWGVVPIPGNIIEKAISPGGAAFMGFAIPVHDADYPILAPGNVHAIPESGASAFSQPLEVLTDLDAYARATLKDEQPDVLAKTMIRAVSKQVAVAVASNEAKKHGGEFGEVLGLAVNLLGSTAATLSEVADTRSWSTLPNHVTGTLLDLPAGRYRLTLETAAGTVECGGVAVEPGRVIVVPVRTFPEPLRYQTEK
jgi:hypothetical protein